MLKEERLRSYVGKLLENKILITRGERKGTQYLINSELIKASSLNIKPSLKTIEIHSLKALIEQDLKIHPDSKIGEIYSRIPDIAYKDLQKAIYELVNEGILNHTPDKTHRKYCLAKKNRE
jgi:ATP-dependent DNA helicase RecG